MNVGYLDRNVSCGDTAEGIIIIFRVFKHEVSGVSFQSINRHIFINCFRFSLLLIKCFCLHSLLEKKAKIDSEREEPLNQAQKFRPHIFHALF